MSLCISNLCATPHRVPLRRTFTTARRRQTHAENVLVQVRLSDGTEGWGEASPAPYVTGEDDSSVLAAIEAAAGVLVDLEADRPARFLGSLREVLPEAPTARSAVEIALADALARQAGRSLWRWLGGARRCVVSDLTIPICALEEASEEAARAAEMGFEHLKVKVGGESVEEDEERVRAIAQAAPGCRIRLDANQGFTPDAALKFVARLQAADVRLEILEQPVPWDDLPALASVTARSPVPVIADESVKSAADAMRVARLEAAHGVNIKLAKSGIQESLGIIAVCRAAGLSLMIGCMMESDLGIAAAAHFACGTGAFRYLDLDSHLLIGLPAPYIGFRQRGGVISVVGSGAGLGWRTETAPAPGETGAVIGENGLQVQESS